LATCIADARQSAGIPARDGGYRFNPHVTLLYRNSAPFTETVTPFAWEVREFVLIHSLLGQTRHTPLGMWPLKGPDPDQFDLF
jgi:2'-5' RNA ligase